MSDVSLARTRSESADEFFPAALCSLFSQLSFDTNAHTHITRAALWIVLEREKGESGGESGTTKWRTGRFLLSKTTTKEEEHHLHRIRSAGNDRPRDKNTKL